MCANLNELDYAKITDRSSGSRAHEQVGAAGTSALSAGVQAQDVPIYIMCHHGSRSGQVTAWLAQQGWKNIFNVRGGIDEYARKVDPSVGMY